MIAIKQAKESPKEVNDEEKKVEEEKKWMEKYQFSDARIYSVHDWLYAYWFVAVRRFLDNIIIQVVERHLLGPYGPLKIFSGELLDGLNDDELEKLAGEDENKMNERKAIQERVHGLEDALRKAAIAVP